MRARPRSRAKARASCTARATRCTTAVSSPPWAARRRSSPHRSRWRASRTSGSICARIAAPTRASGRSTCCRSCRSATRRSTTRSRSRTAQLRGFGASSAFRRFSTAPRRPQPHRRHLADVRRGEFEALAGRALADPRWRFDYGDAAHATAGAVAVGARPFLIAYNVELATGDLALARRIAAALRESGGGLRTLRCLGLRLADDRVQVSCNITDVDAVPLYRVTELVRRAARAGGAEVARSELIGLAPKRAVDRAARAYESAERHPRPS